MPQLAVPAQRDRPFCTAELCAEIFLNKQSKLGNSMANNENIDEKFLLKATLTPAGENFKSTYLLGELNLGNLDKLYRYVPADQLKADIKGEHLVFVSPLLWEDPYEQRFIKADFKTVYGFTQPDFVCLCFTSDAYEMAAAAWRMYSTRERKTLVKVEYDANELLHQLDDFCTNNGLQLIISKVSYGLTKAQLRDDPVKSVLGDDVKNKVQAFSNEHFFSLLSVKRKAFAFESEIRFFITGPEENLKINENHLLPIKMDLRRVINKVMVEPKDPKYLDPPQRADYNKLKSENDETYKKMFHPLGIRTIGSTLYSEIPTNILIK